MRKKIAIISICFILLLSGCGVTLKVGSPTVNYDKTEYSVKIDDDITPNEKEVQFMNIQWGTTYKEVDEIHGELGLWELYGEEYKTFSVSEVALGDYKGIDFEYSDINVIGNCYNSEMEVAGYTTKEITMYFAYTLNEDGTLNQNYKDSIFYGARYIFDSQNLAAMSDDLKEKISDIYGEPQKVTTDIDLYKNVYTYTYWYGANDTLLVMKTLNSENDTTDLYSDEITLAYVWLPGDEYLQKASDTLKKQAIEKEEANYGNENKDGL